MSTAAHHPGTVGEPTAHLTVFRGDKSGHADAAWTPVREGPPVPARRPLAMLPGGRRPVIALLDSGVENHPWLRTPDPADPFWIEVPDLPHDGWEPPPVPPKLDGCGEPALDKFYGHGTFMAGVLRQHAPDAQVLSLRLMDDTGGVFESSVIRAVEWLTAEVASGRRRVDVVCMAFGRLAQPDDAAPDQPLRKALSELGRLGIPVVASAGNGNGTAGCGCDCPTCPASFTTDPRLSVVSVGAGTSAADRADFSNFGCWVDQWEPGTNVLSTMPLTTEKPTEQDEVSNGFARWSGTSFSAARHAAVLAQQRVTEATEPVPSDG